MHKGWVSVITPTIPGREAMLKRAIASVEAQVRRPNIHFISMDVDGIGCAEMKNRMIRRATTEWVAFLDDDDEWLPNHLQVLMEAAESFSGYDLYYPWFEPVGMSDPLACPVNGSMKNPFGVPFGEEQRRHILEVDNFIPVTVLARTEAVLDAGGFQTTSPPSPVYDRDDLGLWRAMLRAGCDFYHVPVITWRYHHHPGHTGGYGWREKAVGV